MARKKKTTFLDMIGLSGILKLKNPYHRGIKILVWVIGGYLLFYGMEAHFGVTNFFAVVLGSIAFSVIANLIVDAIFKVKK